MEQVESAVLEEQVVDYIVEHGNVSEKKIAFETYMNMSETA